MKLPIYSMPIDAYLEASLVERRQYYLKQNKKFATLEKKLLKIGGKKLIYHVQMLFLKELIASGKCNKLPVEVFNGPNSECHSISFLFTEHNRRAQFIHGFALSEDGLWRQHSWIVMDGKLIEPTSIKRIDYFGIKLSGKEINHLFHK